jgi:GNAT superfamily N-acetyltransferase
MVQIKIGSQNLVIPMFQKAKTSAWIVLTCALHIYASHGPENMISLNEVSVELLKDHLELAGDCSKIWYDVLGKKHYPEYEPIRDKHTQFVKEHANDTELPLMLVAIVNYKPIGMCALRKTCYPRSGVVPWADGHPEITPWLAGFVVAEAYQNKGVGTKLAKEVLKHARDKLGFDTAYVLPESPEIATTYTRKGCVKIADVTRDGEKTSVMKVDIANQLESD